MSKNLKSTYILFFIFSAIMISWHTLSNFFSGVAISFIALLAIIFITILIMLNHKDVWSRTKDLLILSGAFAVLEMIVYFACEFGYGEVLKGFIVYQNILSFFGILFFAYIAFRFATEHIGKKIGFIEFILGNKKQAKSQKKTKEISNGCLEEKPKHKNKEVQTNIESTTNNDDDVEIIVSEDEE